MNVLPTTSTLSHNSTLFITATLTSQTPTPACSGTKTYTFTYTDCSGATKTWDYVYTISPPVFTAPANGSSTVACPADANVVPVAPTASDNCGRAITATLTSQTPTPFFFNNTASTEIYTLSLHDALPIYYVYTISPPVFTAPANGSSTVACPSDANVVPVAPTASDNCGRAISSKDTWEGQKPTCRGTKTY